MVGPPDLRDRVRCNRTIGPLACKLIRSYVQAPPPEFGLAMLGLKTFLIEVGLDPGELSSEPVLPALRPRHGVFTARDFGGPLLNRHLGVCGNVNIALAKLERLADGIYLPIQDSSRSREDATGLCNNFDVTAKITARPTALSLGISGAFTKEAVVCFRALCQTQVSGNSEAKEPESFGNWASVGSGQGR